MSDHRYAWCIFGLLAWAAAGASLCAGEIADRPAVDSLPDAAQLLELDHYSPAALKQARACRQQLRSGADSDARLRYALALVFLRQHAQDEALTLLDELLAQKPDALYLGRAKIWAQMSRHDERGALAETRRLADVLARTAPLAGAEEASPAVAAERRITAYFLGRVFSYLELPHADALPVGEIAECRQYLWPRLGDAQDRFAGGEQEFAEQAWHERLAVNREPAKHFGPRSFKLAAPKLDLKTIDEAQADLDFAIETARLDAQTQIQAANQTVDEAYENILVDQFELNTLRQNAAANSVKLQMLKLDLTVAGMANPGGIDPAQRANFWQLAIQNSQRMTLPTFLVRDINRRILALPATVAQRDALVAAKTEKLQRLSAQAAQLRRTERRLKTVQQAEAKKRDAGQRNPLSMKQPSFAVSQPFAFEAEKRRVLKMTEL